MTKFQESDENFKPVIIKNESDPSMQATNASAVFCFSILALIAGFWFIPKEFAGFLIGILIYVGVRYLFLIYYKRRKAKNDFIIKQLNEKLRDPDYWKDPAFKEKLRDPIYWRDKI